TLVAKMGALHSSIQIKGDDLQLRKEQLESLRNKALIEDTSIIETTKARIESLRDRLKSTLALIEQSAQHIAELETLKDGFRDVKSFVFNSMLNEVNARVHQYLSHLFEVP